MSDDLVGRYRRVYTRIWRDPKFMRMSQAEQRLVLYILSGPQTNRIGLFVFSIATAAEDLRLEAKTLRKALVNITGSFGWMFDPDSRVLFIPSWWRWNLAVNSNIFKGNLKDVSEIPSCGLFDAFAANTEFISNVSEPGKQSFRESFVEALQRRAPKASPTSGAGAGAFSESEALSRRRRAKNASEETNTVSVFTAPAHLVQVAREMFKLTSPNQPIDVLVDAFWNVQRSMPGHGGGQCPRNEVVDAINAALAERRRASA